MCAANRHREVRRASAILQAVQSLEPRRLFAAGDLDPAFAGGTVLQDFIHGDDMAFAMALQSDGKVLLAGHAASGGATGNDFAVARFLSNGSLDPTFGAGGEVLTDMGSAYDSINAIAVQSDGKIVVAGETVRDATSTDFALARYNADGSLDGTFGTSGKVVTDLSHDTDQLNAMNLMPDGRIVVTGWSMVNGLPQFAAARYTAAGNLDSTFGGSGHIVAPFANGYSQAQSMAMLSDGSFIAAGSVYDFNSGQRDFAAVHVLVNGGIDSSFGQQGFAQIDLGGDNESAKRGPWSNPMECLSSLASITTPIPVRTTSR